MLFLCFELLVLFLSETLAQLTELRAPIVAVGSSGCRLRPFGCDLNCPNGFRWGVAGACSCLCNDEPCQQKRCAANELCRRGEDGGVQCVPRIVSSASLDSLTKPGECPRLMGGLCVFRCNSDTQCTGALKCCNNGCGRECAVAINSFPIVANVPIRPITVPPRREEYRQFGSPFESVVVRAGSCPPRGNVRNRSCAVECTKDADCSGVNKCCENGCGRVCSPPDKATGCIHLVSAISRLPGKALANGYIPKCSSDGRFERIQCDKVYCWCVDAMNGAEIPGTKLFKESGPPDCQGPRECPDFECQNSCPFGVKTQQNGCPLSNCECRNVCDDISCETNSEVCQLVEPDCAQAPCLPVPRCLLNPCPRGLPMTLPNGVTALCTHTSQCSRNHWCHLVGYNGLGFCCERPEDEMHHGQCEARAPRFQQQHCQSGCHVDTECQARSKCCFDGCGLSCMPIDISTGSTYNRLPNITESVDEETLKASLSSTLGECPERLSPLGVSTCDVECKSDVDCPKLKRCCRVGCSAICSYPTRTTACIHEAITAEIYGIGKKPKCDEDGKFQSIQCDRRGCYCVNIDDGNEVANTRVAIGENPKCDGRSLTCEPMICTKKCTHGFEVSADGCTICKCHNPCKDVRCPHDKFCIMSDVQCFQQSHCPQQTRCVVNVCPSGSPFSLADNQVELCRQDVDCPNGYWCNVVGLNAKGMCCPEPKRQSQSGQCPTRTPLIDGIETCKVRCRSDEDCESNEKCCYDGCGLGCTAVKGLAISTDSLQTSDVTSTHNPSSIGKCASYPIRNDCERSQKDSCANDDDCPQLQKCCYTGCAKTCVYPHSTTGCLHLKTALYKISSKVSVRCNDDGSFESIQCDEHYCWCVLKDGKEIDGTRVTNDGSPNCESRRLCAQLKCPNNLNCAYGYEHDSNGCSTCRCYNPCKGIECSSEDDVCVTYVPDCLNPPCIPVPRCVLNACPKGEPALDESSFEPIVCRTNVHCSHLGSTFFCRTFRNSGGYCCPGTEPRSHSGSCPRIVESASCSLECRVDNDCSSNEKCCYNGCGLSCLPAESEESIRRNDEKIGKCAKIVSENSTCAGSRKDVCERDTDCDGVQKCCEQKCGKTCVYAQVTTACLHAQGAAEHFRGSAYIPQCDAKGEFARVQQFGSLRWCVGDDGREISGTREVYRAPNCERPRSCPLISCTQHCPLGFDKDEDGCERCRCRDPCRDVRCPQWHVCRLTQQQCLNGDCDPIPKCVLNACPKGDPLISQDTQLLRVCDISADQRCPVGYFCHRIGIDSATTGYCCLGNEPALSTPQCAAVLSKAQPEPTNCALECRQSSDCSNGSCCFNGCGTACIAIAKVHNGKQTIMPVTAISVTRGDGTEKLGVCPAEVTSADRCGNECVGDGDCPEFQKCCTTNCGRSCLFPHVATACIHRVATTAQTINAKVLRKRDIPRCNSDGTFNEIQCNQEDRQCWCVDVHSGEELLGTRISSLAVQPNCNAPKVCATTCGDVKCDFGVRLDRSGCPLNDLCECKSPCEDVKCSNSNDICVLKQMQCLSKPCPPIPICKPNPCAGESRALNDAKGNVQMCSHDRSCNEGHCKFLKDENNLGVCCKSETFMTHFAKTKKLGECPTDLRRHNESTSAECAKECESDFECEDVDKCCEYGCKRICVSPQRTTNCILLRAAISKLKKNGIAVYINRPMCDAETGMFSSVQCDDSGLCWCVDMVTGNEIYATKAKLPSSTFNVCQNKKACAVACDDRSSVCPFGLETDTEGCSRSAVCRCRNPCDSLSCPTGSVCLLRPRECSDRLCIPVPTCERNPCLNEQKPAVEPRTFTQFTCVENRTQICPTGFYCTGYDEANRGICCPGQEKIAGDDDSQDVMCAHGDPFSNLADGSPLRCSQASNPCPSTHFCAMKPTQATGICCVTKRYVCNLAMDSGPCAIKMNRYFYDATTHSCVEFEYGGCSGNLNNFISKVECEHFCLGSDLDTSSAFLSETMPSDLYQVGFSLSGPLLRDKHRPDINDVFRDYIEKRFNVDDTEISDLTIHDDNTVQFSLHSPNAQQKAANISNAVSDGSFQFVYNEDTYRAEPHSWFTHQMTYEESATSPAIFWTLVGASILFGVIIFAALLFACCFLYRKGRNRNGTSSYRGQSPSRYTTNTGYATPITNSPKSDSPVTPSQRVFTTDDIDQMKRGPRSTLSWQDAQGIHTQGGRRPSRTTLYY